MIRGHYRRFIEVVARGRRLPAEQIEASAEGRVWTGRKALELGLVDRRGGLSVAIAAARDTGDDARRALVEALRPPMPAFPRYLVPKQLGSAIALATVFENGSALALEPFELRVF